MIFLELVGLVALLAVFGIGAKHILFYFAERERNKNAPPKP